MASRDIELEPADDISVSTVGEPGQREFFLHARRGGEAVTLACEKFHVEGLVTRIKQLLEANGLQETAAAPATPGGAGSSSTAWTIAELGLGYHEARRLFVIVAREAVDAEGEEAATARFWAGPELIQRFLKQAAEVLAGGRQTCPRCGLPMDPAGHPCPVLNGSRPIF